MLLPEYFRIWMGRFATKRMKPSREGRASEEVGRLIITGRQSRTAVGVGKRVFERTKNQLGVALENIWISHRRDCSLGARCECVAL